jgi:hypothetical protein
MSRAKAEVEMIGPANLQEKSQGLGQSKGWPDRSPSQLRNRGEIVVYQENAPTISRGKNTIFELTHMAKAASCRPCPEKRSGL